LNLNQTKMLQKALAYGRLRDSRGSMKR